MSRTKWNLWRGLMLACGTLLCLSYVYHFSSISRSQKPDPDRSPCKALKSRSRHGRYGSLALRPEELHVQNPFDIRVPLPFLANYRNPCWLENRGVIKLRCLPYFLLIGMSHSATTDLFLRLAAHPDIVSPAGAQTEEMSRLKPKNVSVAKWRGMFQKYKEPNYWSKLWRGNRNVSDYVDFFQEAAGDIHSREAASGSSGAVTFEASTSTFWDNSLWQQSPNNMNLRQPKYLNQHYIKCVLPDIKLLLILRDPVERFYSEYKDTDQSTQNFENYVTSSIQDWEKCLMELGFKACLYSDAAKLPIVRGMYAYFLADWYGVFSAEQIAVIQYEEYIKHPQEKLSKIYEFLGLEDQPAVFDDMVHSLSIAEHTQDTSPMLSSTRELLANFYKPFNQQLSKLLHDERFLWL